VGAQPPPRSVVNYPINAIFLASLTPAVTPPKQKNTERSKNTKYIRFWKSALRKWAEGGKIQWGSTEEPDQLKNERAI
jgi:hypothetical protein